MGAMRSYGGLGSLIVLLVVLVASCPSVVESSPSKHDEMIGAMNAMKSAREFGQMAHGAFVHFRNNHKRDDASRRVVEVTADESEYEYDGGEHLRGLGGRSTSYSSSSGDESSSARHKRRKGSKGSKGKGSKGSKGRGTYRSKSSKRHSGHSSKGTKRSKGSTKSRKKGSRDDSCDAKLAQMEEEGNQPNYLFVQMGKTCSLQREISGRHFLVSDLADETWAFSDRPMQVETTWPTTRFFDQFERIFGDDKPNAAMTFVRDESESDGQFAGPLVSVLITATYVDVANENGTATSYTYELEQSDEQATAAPLDEFFVAGSGGEDGVADFDFCSIFIDSTEEHHSQGCGDTCTLSRDCLIVGGPNPCQYCNTGTCERDREGTCGNTCSSDSDCGDFEGGPNPCTYCNEGECASVAPPPPTPSGQGCGSTCTVTSDCLIVGGENPCPWCNTGTCEENREGACGVECTSDSLCEGFVGGPNPCMYCNNGECASVSAAPAPAPTPADTCGSQGVCSGDDDCDPDNSCVCYSGHYGRPPYCGEWDANDQPASCGPDGVCSGDDDCDPNNSCVCYSGHYGRPSYCGEWDENNQADSEPESLASNSAGQGCGNTCSLSRDCLIAGGPNPCQYCNTGTCERDREGTCGNTCSGDSDCGDFEGGPNPCTYCNEGECASVSATPPPAPTPADTCGSQGVCSGDDDCDPDNSCVCYSGHYGRPPYCGEWDADDQPASCGPDGVCSGDDDCDPDNSCVCYSGHYGRPSYCGEWDENNQPGT